MKDKVLDRLNLLNIEIERLIDERTNLLDDNMYRYADFKIGDIVINTRNNLKGVVTQHHRNIRYILGKNIDDNLNNIQCIIEYENSNTTDNIGCYGINKHPFILAPVEENIE